MSNKYFLVFLALLILPTFVSAQSSGLCGTSLDTESAMAMNARALANRQIMDAGIATERDEVIFIPIKYHLFGKSDSSQVATAIDILGLHCRLNEEYIEHDIQFYINDGFKYYYNDDYFENPGDFASFLNSQRSNNSVNVWIGKNADLPNTPEGGIVLGYYSPGNDWIVLRKSEAAYDRDTYAHEIGHFLSLNHPFNGWECQLWDDYSAANMGECAPTTSPCNSIATELVDGSNCATSGDFLCDTPANYGLGYSSPTCSYNGNACDPMGLTLEPDPTNIMGYFRDCPDQSFTPEQVEMILVDYNSSTRNYLRTDGGPRNAAEITTTTELTSPENVTALTYENVKLDWEDTPNAGKYIVQTAVNASFTLFLRSTIVDVNSSVVLNYLVPETTHYWRVAPFNEYNTCIEWSEKWSFTTGIGFEVFETAKGLTEFLVRPNPVKSGSDLIFLISSGKPISADFELISVDGKLVYTRKGIEFLQGESSLIINTESLSAGLYFAVISSAGTTLKQRIIVL